MVYVFFSLALFIEYTFIEICTYIWCFLIFFYYPKGFNATFSNISAIAWRPVLVVEEAGVP
jgi:hypothetical protein